MEIDARQTMGRDAAILGMTLMNASAEDRARIHAALGAGLANGSLKPVVGREFPLADAAASHAAVMEPRRLRQDRAGPLKRAWGQAQVGALRRFGPDPSERNAPFRA